MNNSKHLFHISGKKGSGKTTLLSWLADAGYFTTEVRFHLEKAIAANKFDATDIPVPFMWTEPMMNLCYESIKEQNLVFLTGLYHPDELSFFQKGYSLHSIGIQVDDAIRHQRILQRKREKEQILTLEEIEFKDRKRDGTAPGYKADINMLISESEIILTNNGSIEDFRKEYERLIEYVQECYQFI